MRLDHEMQATRKLKRLSKLGLAEFGIGLQTEQKLEQEGIRTVGALVERVSERFLAAEEEKRQRSKRSRRHPYRPPADETVTSFLDTRVSGSAIRSPSVDLLLKLLQSESRRLILVCLAGGETDVGTLARSCRVDPPHVSQSLSALYRCGMLLRRREGKHVFYRLHDVLQPAVRDGMIHIEIPAENGERLTLDLRSDGTAMSSGSDHCALQARGDKPELNGHVSDKSKPSLPASSRAPS